MPRVYLYLLTAVCLFPAAAAPAADPTPTLAVAQGVIDKASKDSLTVQPRGSESGKFAKNLKLRLTGTSHITTVAAEKRDGKTVLVQRDADPGELQPHQAVAVIYAEGPGGLTLLSAVVQPAGEK
jgi:hypothetical protein